jgi:hypothetical protein
LRTFQVSENNKGLVTWSIAEVVGNRLRPLSDVHTWIADDASVTANRIGLITIQAGGVQIEDGAARFTS